MNGLRAGFDAAGAAWEVDLEEGMTARLNGEPVCSLNDLGLYCIVFDEAGGEVVDAVAFTTEEDFSLKRVL